MSNPSIGKSSKTKYIITIRSSFAKNWKQRNKTTKNREYKPKFQKEFKLIVFRMNILILSSRWKRLFQPILGYCS